MVTTSCLGDSLKNTRLRCDKPFLWTIIRCHAMKTSCIIATEHKYELNTVHLTSRILNYGLNYSKALRYTASSCTDLDNARFWIGSQKIWDAQIYVMKNLSYTFFDDIAFALLGNQVPRILRYTSLSIPQNMCISRPYCTTLFKSCF